MQECITVSYGNVSGRARQYPYFQVAKYRSHWTKDGREVWWYVTHAGTAYRSYNKCLRIAREMASPHCPLILGVRHCVPVNSEIL